MYVCCAAVSLTGTAGRRSQRNSQHGHVRRRCQTVGWSAMSIGDNAISAPATMATLPWWQTGCQLYAVAHDRRRCKQRHISNREENSAVSILPGFGQTEQINSAVMTGNTKGLFRMRTSTWHGWTHACRRTSPHIDGYIYNICKCYMLMIFSVIIYVIKMQIKHMIISNLITGCYYCGNGRCRASTCDMVRYNCVKMMPKSHSSWSVRCTTSGNARQRAQCECNGALHTFDGNAR